MMLEIKKTVIELSGEMPTQCYRKYHLTINGWIVESLDTFEQYGCWETSIEFRKATAEEIEELEII